MSSRHLMVLCSTWHLNSKFSKSHWSCNKKDLEFCLISANWMLNLSQIWSKSVPPHGYLDDDVCRKELRWEFRSRRWSFACLSSPSHGRENAILAQRPPGRDSKGRKHGTYMIIYVQALEEVWTDVQKMSRTIRNHWNHLWLQVCRTCIPTTFISFGEKYESVSGSRWWSYRCTASMWVKFNFSKNISIFSMFQHLGRFHDRFRRVELLSCPLLAQIDSRSMPLWKQSVDFFVRKIPKSKSFEIHKSTSSCTEQGDCTGAAQSGRLAMGAL